jgi:hypothetical protein
MPEELYNEVKVHPLTSQHEVVEKIRAEWRRRHPDALRRNLGRKPTKEECDKARAAISQLEKAEQWIGNAFYWTSYHLFGEVVHSSAHCTMDHGRGNKSIPHT